MTVETLWPFLLAALAMELTPGPNMFYIALVSAQHGRRAGLAAITGITLGLLIIGLLAAIGFAAIVAGNAALYEMIRWAGIAYLLWLAYDTWRDTVVNIGPVALHHVMRESFLRGLITNVLNPKAFLFYISVLPAFISHASAYRTHAIWLTCLYVAIATTVHAVIVFGAGSVSHQLEHPERRKIAGRVFAGLLVLVAVWLFMKTARG